MKKITLLFVLLLASSLFSQRKTIFEGEIENGGFGAPVIKLSPIKNELGVLVGGYGGWLINHQLLIGGGGFGLVNNIKANDDIQRVFNYYAQPYLSFGYGGAILEFYFNPDEVLHSSISLLIGGGEVSYRGDNFSENKNLGGTNDNTKGDGVFVLEPGISGELNVASYLKIGFSISYRYVSGVNIYGISNSDLSNVAGGIAFKFGKF